MKSCSWFKAFPEPFDLGIEVKNDCQLDSKAVILVWQSELTPYPIATPSRNSKKVPA